MTETQVVNALPLVRWTASTVRAPLPPWIDVEDLTQDGAVSLLLAAPRFDPARGSFATFAVARVRGAMLDALRRAAWPRRLRAQRRRFEAARDALRAQTGEAPSDAALAGELRMDPVAFGQLERRIAAFDQGLSLPVSVEPTPDRQYAQRALMARVVRAVGRLPARERDVVRQHFLGDLTFRQIAAAQGVSEGRIHQLKNRALKRLRLSLVVP